MDIYLAINIIVLTRLKMTFTLNFISFIFILFYFILFFLNRQGKGTIKGHQIVIGPRPDLETRQPIGLMGGLARCY